jgi:S-adenosylmethionine:tRNA ribosyltransferase-isomerase
MATPRNLQILDYTYNLPEDRIARYPLPDRDSSKLLIYKGGNITEGHYRDLGDHIPTGAFMVFNDTKVIEARLLMHKATGGQIEIFCLEPLDTEPSGAMMQQGHATWKCLVGGAGKWKEGPLEKEWTGTAGDVRLSAEKAGTLPDGYKIRFSWTPADLHFAEVLHRAGLIPLPPYLNRQAEQSDAERYQTVYARFDGSVAAPTAGLHFTDNLLHGLSNKGVKTGFVTLHVGAGTFKPVKAERMEDHVMHAEWIDVPADFIAQLIRAAGGGETSTRGNATSPPAPLIPVGTTALRTLESLYWMGVKVLNGPIADMEALALTQWELYDELPQGVDRAEALAALLRWLREKGKDRLVTQTQLLIAPGYRVRMADALITNFHQPGSTLLLLVAALVGADWEQVYAYALEHDFRFLSYGDGSLLWF